jgi:hypothetical protein
LSEPLSPSLGLARGFCNEEAGLNLVAKVVVPILGSTVQFGPCSKQGFVIRISMWKYASLEEFVAVFLGSLGQSDPLGILMSAI